MIAKSFKMRKALADEFKEACEKAGVSQSGQIVEMMSRFIEEQKKSERYRFRGRVNMLY